MVKPGFFAEWATVGFSQFFFVSEPSTGRVCAEKYLVAVILVVEIFLCWFERFSLFFGESRRMRVDSARNVSFLIHNEFPSWSIFADGHIE